MPESAIPSTDGTVTACAALEASGKSWILAVGDPSDASKTGIHRLKPHGAGGLPAKLGQARERASASGDARALLVCEAGCEGFWPARRLEGEDPEVVVCDPASLEAVRRKRKAKTDRTGARRMVRAPPAWDGGGLDAMSPAPVPTVAEEDAKRLMRRRDRPVKERRRLADTVAGLLRLHGISPGGPARKGFRERLEGMRTGYGTQLPPGLPAEIHGLPDRLEPGVAELKAAGAEKAAALEVSREALDSLPEERAAAREEVSGGLPAEDGGTEAEAAPPRGRARCPAVPVQLRGIGPNGALVLGNGLFYRDFRNRRQLACMAGLAPVPFAGGSVGHDQGIGRSGSPMLRKHLVEMAWRWLRHQPDSALSAWFRNCVSARDGRSRKRGIVALARRLPVALWRYATTGLVPDGAVLSAA